MADEKPVPAPEAVDQPEATSATDKPAEMELDKPTTADEKPTGKLKFDILLYMNHIPLVEAVYIGQRLPATSVFVRPTSADSPVPPPETTNTTVDKNEVEAQAEKPDTTDDATKVQDEEHPDSADAKTEADEPNGTPASAKKSSKDRRRSTGYADKKLNRKKSQTRLTHLDAKPGDMFLARLRSYAPWPAIICDEEILPSSLLDTRPVTALQQDGTYRADYAEGGRRAHERTFPVMFFETNEFAWVVNTNLTPLDPEDCKNISEKNKTKQLIGAYKVASEGNDLAHFKKVLAEHETALEEERQELEREVEEKAKAKADKAAMKTKRKSKVAETDVEMEDAEETKTPKSTKKRKKVETDAETEKPAKTPKTATKLKLTTPKAPAEEKKKTPATKTKKAAPKKGKAAAAAAPSDEEETPEVKEPEKQVDPEELKKKKEKEKLTCYSVLFLRHKLQKGFISRDQPPKEEEMDVMATYFDKLEKHADLEVSIIRSTKINKVLKMIIKLNSIPRDEEFNFRQRAMAILSSWKSVLDSDAPAASTDKEDKDDKPAANGASKKEESAETPKVETEEEKDSEIKPTNDTPMPDADSEKPAEEKSE
ncbi:uncharacterized protein N7483_004642 [Penicillium malachiteum]|uniref:uncharacterized protein n=1 Tax=Penicillium malachiteum TaxID=1324776 RepID=UPI002548EAF1|nr:uncharacterized protein N7483_004642 [Penicillium malachiteum]KAJ5730134.1 hypothetical protein N7483_004642 [Penicillium malachiteum]